ncbi:FAD-dependent oxidoreductase [Thermogemmatispora sp.]|uniref:FAD-dependent oxidoreductase n=1 Tax=Thermogemmatispora sp. TaxID=1968838 RepID=UPI0035E45F40
MSNDTTVVIGAGPYGLSIGAYLLGRSQPVLVFGRTMEFWQQMPSGFHLKSVWSASTLFDPDGRYSLDRYCAATGRPRQEPLPIRLFLDYCCWFQRQAVPNVDPTYISRLARDGEVFVIELADGRSLKARRVVVASGIAPFSYVPEFARHLPPELATHTQAHRDFAGFAGREVVVVGRGQSALESSALLHEAGAHVELIARGPVIWINRTLYHRTGPARRIFYPPSDVGPPGLNWLVASPLLFRLFPEKTRYALDRRAVRPAGAEWLRPRVEGHVRITDTAEVVKAVPRGERLELTLSDGSTRLVDHLFLGTGYRPDIHKLAFLDEALRAQILARDGYPVLNEWFESSVPRLHFAGALANHSFGPICRFVAGAKIPARQILRCAQRDRHPVYSA